MIYCVVIVDRHRGGDLRGAQQENKLRIRIGSWGRKREHWERQWGDFGQTVTSWPAQQRFELQLDRQRPLRDHLQRGALSYPSQ